MKVGAILEITVFLMLSVTSTVVADNIKYNTKEELVSAFVKAVNDKSVDEYKQIIHPLCLKVISKDNEDFYDKVFMKNLGYEIPSNYKVSFKQLGDNDDFLKLFRRDFIYLVQPTGHFELYYNETENSFVNMMIYIVNDKLGWHIIIPQPTQETLKKFRAQGVKDTEHQKRCEQIIQIMDKNIYVQIMEHLKNKNLVTAIHYYQKSSGESLEISKMVVEEIRKREKLEW